MKLIKFLKGKAGKFSLSAMQAVGLSAAVGVAGIAAWQMMGSSSQPNLNTVFSSASADQDVVFVAGASGGMYGGGAYADGGEVRSGIRTTMSKDLQLMQTDAQNASATPEAAFVQQEQKVSAYKMDGASGGLGLGANVGKDSSADMPSDMAAIQQQIADLQASVAAKKQAAEAAAVANAAGDATQVAAALKGKGGKWGMSGEMARASGSNLQSTPLQAGRPGQEGERVSASGVLGGAQANVPPMLEGATRAPKFEGGRDSVIGAGGRLDNVDSLAMLQKQSAEIARHGNRSTNEGTKVFMASNKLSGGIQLSGGESLAGGTASSSDFADDAISALGGALSSVSTEVIDYETNREELRLKIRDFVKSCNRWSYATPAFSWIGSLAKLRKRNQLRDEISEFKAKWGETTYETENTSGGYANVARDVVDDAYRAINWFGLPQRRAKKWGAQYWGDEDAFVDVATPEPPPSEEEKPTNPYGENKGDGGLSNDSPR